MAFELGSGDKLVLLAQGLDQIDIGLTVFDHDLVRPRLELARQFLPHRFERTRPSDGKTLEIMGMPTPDGGMVTTYLDVSERKAQERALQRERERLRNILKGTNAGSYEVNLQTGLVQINNRGAKLTGHSREELSSLTLQTLPAKSIPTM